MTPEVKVIEKQAMNLPIDDKVVLTETLLQSIYAEKLIDVEDSWLQEVEKRYSRYSDVDSEGAQVEHVFDDIRKKLSWKKRARLDRQK